MSFNIRSLFVSCAIVAMASCSNSVQDTGATKQISLSPTTQQPIHNETQIEFVSSDDRKVSAYRGYFMVPENRNNPESREIKLHYVRFPATGKKAGTPIVYLAGGPGGSGIRTAEGPRFPLFMDMREFGDVIAFDQRGTSEESALPVCKSTQVIPDAVYMSDEAHVRSYRRAAKECLTFWENENIDIHGYTTQESVHDLDELRQHLGVKKLSLWGISYGSHLSLATIKTLEGKIDKVVLASVEGLDQTVKMPARTDAYFDRLQDVIDADETLSRQYPDIIGLMHRVHTKLEAKPIMLTATLEDGSSAQYLLQRRDMQQIMSGSISDPQGALWALPIYAELDRGDTTIITDLMSQWLDPGAPIQFYPMTFAMDIASGTGEARLAEITRLAETSLIKDFLNFPMPHLDGVVPGLDLGDKFRENPISEVPVLVLSGTLDGRTYVESQREAVSGLANAQIITVKNAGHNLFMSSPDVTAIIQTFMRGEKILIDELTVEIPDL